jgi:hypothetical protein
VGLIGPTEKRKAHPMNNTYSMTKVIAELVNRLAHVGRKTGKERNRDKTEGKAGNLAGSKR